MIELLHQIEQIDTQIFLFFNGFHNEYWDYFMMIFSDRFVWVPFYASFIFVLLKNFPVKVVMSTIVVITLIILFSDQTASGILKPLVARMRPSNPDNPISRWYMLFKDIGVADMVSHLLMQPMHGAWPSLPNIWFAGANSRYSYACGH